MTRYFLRHTGKLLFPHLAHDQRKRRMQIILMVIAVSLFSIGGLSVWMMSAGASAGHVLAMPGVFPLQN